MNRTLILIFLLFAAYLPVPKYLMSLNYKLSFAAALAVMYLISLACALRGSFRFSSGYREIAIFLLFPLAYTVYGLFNGNSAYHMTKELIFFTSPVLVLFILANISISTDDTVKAVVYAGFAFALIQIAFSIYAYTQGALYIEKRYLYRNEFLLLSTGAVPLALALSLGMSSSLLHAVSIRNAVMTAALLLTLGRNEVMFLVFIIFAAALYSIARRIRGTGDAFLYTLLFLIIFSPIAYFAFLLERGPDIEDTSPYWRYLEIQSFYDYFRAADLRWFLFGQGFGSFLRTPVPLKMYAGAIYSELDRFHNFWLYIGFKTGVAGLSVFSALFISYAAGIVRHVRGNNLLFFLYLYILYYIFVKGNIFGLFTMELDITLGIAIYLIHLLKRGGDAKTAGLAVNYGA